MSEQKTKNTPTQQHNNKQLNNVARIICYDIRQQKVLHQLLTAGRGHCTLFSCLCAPVCRSECTYVCMYVCLQLCSFLCWCLTCKPPIFAHRLHSKFAALLTSNRHVFMCICVHACVRVYVCRLYYRWNAVWLLIVRCNNEHEKALSNNFQSRELCHHHDHYNSVSG